MNVLWFGHSLVQLSGEPPLDLPQLVNDLHRAARAEGRTNIPEGRTHVFAVPGRDLGYHLDGAGGAPEKLRESADDSITHVVGIGFMHMLGQRAFDHPTLMDWLHGVLPNRFNSPGRQTEHIYRFIDLVRRQTSNAAWVNYVGPALSNNVGPQGSIDARFACIEQTAASAGVSVLTAPVGRAFRNAEQAAARRPDFNLHLQQADGLHLTPQGAWLAASVLYLRIYGVDPVGLPAPPPYARYLGSSEAEQVSVARFLEEVARDTVTHYAPDCTADALLPEDEKGRARLQAPLS